MTQMPSRLVDVVSALETLEFPYVLFREPSGSHRVLVEGVSEAVVLQGLTNALGSDVTKHVEIATAHDDAAVRVANLGDESSHIVIEVKAGSGKSAASMLWWLALQEGSKAAREVAHTDIKPLNVLVHPRRTNNNPE